ncbi:MAG: hypothetical protein HYS05_19360 [Acidobacteria bacterium]|nr:hypothetical protein [Acidobacteriota bacterium]
MRRTSGLSLAMVVSVVAGAVLAQDDPVLGNWRGTVRTSQGVESPIIITIVRKGEGYVGTASGLGSASEIPLKRVTVSGGRVSFESADDSRLGHVVLAGDLVVDGNALKGPGTVSLGPLRFDVALELRRRARQDVVQPRVEQRADYFLGRWTFEYVGGEFPPLSPGNRTGSVVVSRVGSSNFLAGQVDGDVLGKPYRESLSIGFDPETHMLVFLERHADGVELVSLANWQSPLAIRFQTSPFQTNGRVYQLRRLLSVLSETAFDITEEFSVDAGPYRRLGTARYMRVP